MRECRNYGLKEPERIELGVSFRVNAYWNMELMCEYKFSDNQSMKSNIESSKSYIESLNQTLDKMRNRIDNCIELVSSQMKKVASQIIKS